MAEITEPEAVKLPRIFRINGVPVGDPDPSLDIEGVKKRLTAQYPNLANATASGPKVEMGYEVYSLIYKAETKG